MERKEKSKGILSLLTGVDHKMIAGCLFYALFMTFLGYGIKFESSDMHFHLLMIDKMYSAYHYWLAVLSGGVCLVFLYQAEKIRENEKQRFLRIISDLGKISMMCLIALATIIGIIGLIGGEIFLPYLQIMTIADYALLAFGLVCLLGVWPYNKVHENSVDIVNGYVYYPGEKYFSYPFIKNEILTITKSMRLREMKFPLPVSNKSLMLTLDTYLNIEIQTLIESGQRTLDFHELSKAIEEQVSREIENAINASQERAGHPGYLFEFINNLRLEPKHFSFLNIAVVWPEIGNFSIIG